MMMMMMMIEGLGSTQKKHHDPKKTGAGIQKKQRAGIHKKQRVIFFEYLPVFFLSRGVFIESTLRFSAQLFHLNKNFL